MDRKRKFSNADEDIFTGLTWSASQRRVLTAVLSKSKNVFITGAGGVGKSACISQIVKIFHDRDFKVGVTAHTGVAAITISGQTLFSFMKFTPANLTKSNDDLFKEISKKESNLTFFQSYKALIVDEVSMVDPHIFETMDFILKKSRKDQRPFGGLQVILVGDFFQLPSPSKNTQSLRYIFQTSLFWTLIEEMHDLNEMWRQKDPTFVSLLHRVRKGKQTLKDIQLLHSRKNVILPCEALGIAPTRLYAKNKDVDAINLDEINKLDSDFVDFKIRFGIHNKSSKTDADRALLKLLKDIGATECDFNTKFKEIKTNNIKLKIGSQVMLSSNLDVASGLVNGARGVILRWGETNEDLKKEGESQRTFDLEDSFHQKNEDYFLYPDERLPIVKFACGKTIEVPYVKYTYDHEGNETYAWKIALKLAWATSIHKSQSLTLDAAEIDLAECFDSGMAYVALSRVTSLETLRISRDFQVSVFKVASDVLKFYETPFGVQKALMESLAKESELSAGIDDFEIS